MSRSKSILALTCGGMLLDSAIQASVIPWPNIVPVSIPSGTPYTQTGSPAISSGAAIDDPNLEYYRTYDIQVVVNSASGTDRWLAGDLRAQLPAGCTYYIPPSQDDNVLQQASVHNATGQRFLQVDTMVMIPTNTASFFQNVGLLGRSAFAPGSQSGAIFPSNGSNLDGNPDPDVTTFAPANDQMLVDVAWTVQLPVTGPTGGTFAISRLTIRNDGPNAAFATFIGRVASQLMPANPLSFTYVVGIPVTPEPASVAWLAGAIGVLALRRNRTPVLP